MLNVCAPSPPVPAVSTRSSRFGRTGRTCSRIASAQPAISSAVSPFSRSATRKPPICAGVASPRMISCITSRACVAREVVAVEQSRERAPGSSSEEVPPEKICSQSRPERREHALGMELDAFDRQLAVADAHHLAVGRPRGDLQLVRDRDRGERVVAAGLEVLRQPGEDAAAVVLDGRRLAVQQRLRLRRPRRRTPRRSPGGRGRRRASARAARAGGSARPRCPRPPGGRGRGRSTRCVGSSASASSTVIASFRNTRTSAPSSSNRCTRL